MRKLFLLVCLAVLGVAPAAAELSREEAAVKDRCVANIEEGLYSPKEADRCLKDLPPEGQLYAKLKNEDPDTLNYILKYESLFKELGEFFRDKPEECVIRKRYVALLETDGRAEACVLCELGLGPQPDKTFSWVGRHYGGSLAAAQRAGLAWAYAGSPRQRILSAIGATPDRWGEMKLSERAATLLIETQLSGSQSLPGELAGCSIDVKLDNLPPDIKTAALLYSSGRLGSPGSPQVAGAGADARSSQYAAASSRSKEMAGKSEEEQLAYLGRVFDRNAASGNIRVPDRFSLGQLLGRPAAPAGDYSLPADKWNKVAAEVKTRMLGGVSDLDKKEREPAFSGTKREEEIRQYFTEKGADGKPLREMKFKLADLGDRGTNGAYCPKHASPETCGGLNPGDISVNARMVEAWMRKNNCTADRLTTDPDMMDKLGRHVYSVALHESVHAVRQDDYYRANGVPNARMVDKEVEAFAAQALALKNKLNDPKLSALYRAETSDFDKEVISALEDGGYRGLKKYVRYYDIEGTQGAAAKKIAQMEAGLKELALRKTDPASASASRATAACSWSSMRNCSDEQLTRMTAETYPWYKMAIARQKENISSVNSELERITAQGNPTRSQLLKMSTVKQLNEEGL